MPKGSAQAEGLTFHAASITTSTQANNPHTWGIDGLLRKATVQEAACDLRKLCGPHRMTTHGDIPQQPRSWGEELTKYRISRKEHHKMETLKASEKSLFGVIEEMHSATSLEGLHQTVHKGLALLVRGDCYDMVLCSGQPGGASEFFATPDTYTSEEITYLLEHAAEHPVAQAFQKGATGALCVSQCTSDRKWMGSGLFSDGGYRRLGLRHEVAVEIPGVSRQSLAAFSIIRGRPDFSERDRELLNLIRPHIARAWLQAHRRSLGQSSALLRHLFPVLSGREAEILFWIVEGKQNSEIATILERRLNTIQEHVENIIRKLGMDNRHQMTVAVLRACRL